MKDKLILCKYVAGSQLYGLATPESDLDIRGVFANTKPSHIMGTRRFDHLDKRQGEDDILYYEVRKWLTLVKQSNTQVLEVLFMRDDQFDVLHNYMKKFRDNKYALLDSKQFFKHLLGYMSGELRLANGERRGAIGGKRSAAVDKYGYSPKNFVQLIRLAYIGSEFFKYGLYPVCLKGYGGSKVWDLLRDIKTKPENWTKEQLNELAKAYEDELKVSFDNRQENYKFDEELANDLLCDLYMEIISGKQKSDTGML